MTNIERLIRRDRWLRAFIPKMHTVVCTWMVAGTVVSVIDLLVTAWRGTGFLPFAVAGIHCFALVVMGTAHHLVLRYHLRLLDRIIEELATRVAQRAETEDLDEYLRRSGVDPGSLGEASDEEVERVMKRCFPGKRP